MAVGVLHKITHAQVDRCLAHIKHPKIQKLLLSGYKVSAIDSVLYKMHLKNTKGSLARISVYPHYLTSIMTKLRKSQATKIEEILLARYNAAQILKALKNKHIEITVEDLYRNVGYQHFIVHPNRINKEVAAAKLERWVQQRNQLQQKTLKRAKSSGKTIAKAIEVHCMAETTPPGHIICVVEKTRRRRSEIAEHLPGHFVVSSLKSPPVSARTFVREKADHYEYTQSKGTGKRRPVENVVFFVDTAKEAREFMDKFRWNVEYYFSGKQGEIGYLGLVKLQPGVYEVKWK